MNFQEWYKDGPKLTEHELRISILAWDKCKEEVLKILKKDRNSHGLDYISSKVIDEIEKL